MNRSTSAYPTAPLASQITFIQRDYILRLNNEMLIMNAKRRHPKEYVLLLNKEILIMNV